MGWQPFLLVLLLAVCAASCRVHHRLSLDRPSVPLPAQFCSGKAAERGVLGPWWEEFQLPALNAAMGKAFSDNLELRQAKSRLCQAVAQARVVGANRFPAVNLRGEMSYFEGVAGSFSGGDIGEIGQGMFSQNNSSTFYYLAGELSYEVDFWRRLESETASASANAFALQEEVEAIALVLSGSVVDLWFLIQEQKALLAVLEKQSEVSRTLLDLIELRFSVGISTALDVYQQRLQLAATEVRKPPVRARLRTALHQLAVLLGDAPGCLDEEVVKQELPPLPPFPDIGSPEQLFCRRPDLRAQYQRLQAADWQVAAAVADLFPRLNLFGSWGFRARDIAELFDQELKLLTASLLAPIFDGGRRRAKVEQQKAVVIEQIDRFGELFLVALKEVEDALVEEKEQVERLRQTEQQRSLAEQNLQEATSHYLNGLNDYLTVIAAIQSLQNLEREVISEKKELLSIRARLYRALGGFG